MSWFRVDDGLPDHPKLQELEADPALWCRVVSLWLAAGCYCSRTETDGHISPNRLVRLTPMGKKALKTAQKLVEIGLWSVSESGDFLFHDWADYNPTKAEASAKRKGNLARQRRYRRVRNGVTDGVTDTVSNTPPVPTRPDPSRTEATLQQQQGAPWARALEIFDKCHKAARGHFLGVSEGSQGRQHGTVLWLWASKTAQHDGKDPEEVLRMAAMAALSPGGIGDEVRSVLAVFASQPGKHYAFAKRISAPPPKEYVSPSEQYYLDREEECRQAERDEKNEKTG